VYEPNILLSLELRGRAYFEKGIAYPQKLSERTSVKDSKLGFFDWLERKEERKERQLERLHAQNEELLEGMKKDLERSQKRAAKELGLEYNEENDDC